MKITPTSLTVHQLLSESNVRYVVPAYQRRYSWEEKQIEDLLGDVELLEDSDTHLLGSIVCLTQPLVVGVNSLELVDGQQRLTTLCILLHCIHERLLAAGDRESAQELTPLLTARAMGAAPVRKIALDSLDAALFERLCAGDAAAGAENPALREAFSYLRVWASQQNATKLAHFVYRLKNQALVIRLDVSQAKDAFKLFETINNRGLRLSPTDIIKNFLLGNAARFGEAELALARDHWASIVAGLDGVNAEGFLRQFVSARLRRRVTKSFVVRTLKREFLEGVLEAQRLPEWLRQVGEDTDDDGEDEGEAPDAEAGDDEPAAPERTPARVSFAAFLEQLSRNAKTYGEIVKAKTGKPAIDRRLHNLRLIRAAQTYGFLTYLRVGGCPDVMFEEVLRLTEAFLIRRHVCRMRANETETAFARLCGVDCASPIAEVTATYRAASPSNERFKDDFAVATFTGRLIDRARYCLAQFEMARHGCYPELMVGGPDVVQVEHVIPQKIKTQKAKKAFGAWPDYLGATATARHPKYVSRIGNLTLIAAPLNLKASNRPYQAKAQEYGRSGLMITKSLPTEYPEFRLEQVDERSARLAELATALWPIP